MNKTLRKTMISTIAMLVVAVMSLTGVTYAWFTQADSATVSGMQMSVVAADGGIQVSTSATGGWKNALELADATKTSVQPVSTFDAKNFFQVEWNTSNASEFKTVAVDRTHVWTQTLYVKNTGYEDITVSLDGTNFQDTNNEDTRDASKAAKIAVFVYDSLEASEGNLAFIYSPEDTFKGVKSESDNTYFNPATDTTYTEQQSTDILKTTAADCKFTIEGGSVDDDDVFVETIVKIEVVMWVEGQDADCENKNSNSIFNTELVFKAVQTPSVAG